MNSNILVVKFYLGTDVYSECYGILLEESGSKATVMSFLKADCVMQEFWFRSWRVDTEYGEAPKEQQRSHT